MRAGVSSAQGALQPRSRGFCAEKVSSLEEGVFCCGWYATSPGMEEVQGWWVVLLPFSWDGRRAGIIHVVSVWANSQKKHCLLGFFIRSLLYLLKGYFLCQSSVHPCFHLVIQCVFGNRKFSLVDWSESVDSIHLWVPSRKKVKNLLLPVTLLRKAVYSLSRMCSLLLVLAPYKNSLWGGQEKWCKELRWPLPSAPPVRIPTICSKWAVLVPSLSRADPWAVAEWALCGAEAAPCSAWQDRALGMKLEAETHLNLLCHRTFCTLNLPYAWFQ